MIIALDFDGTCVTHEYPNIGKDIGAVPVLKALVNSGHQLMLWTMRSGKELEEAEQWFKDNDIPLWASNKNPNQNWSTSNKQFANMYIDDAALGCPLTVDFKKSMRSFVDWQKIAEILTSIEVIDKR